MAAMAVAGSAVAASATNLFSSAAFGASSRVQHLGAVRSPTSFNGSRMVAVRASHSSHESFSMRGSANSGTPLGEGAGGNLVGDNQATRQASSTGTPLGEGSINKGSGVNLGDALKVPDVPNPLNKVGELNPLKGGLPDASNVVGDAKDAVQRKVDGAKDMAENAKSTVNSGLPDASTVASEVVSSEGARDAKNAAGEVAKNAAQSVATNSANQFVEGANSNIGVPNPMEAGKALMSKVAGN